MAVIITGGTGAIGSAMARAFAKTNDVAIIYKSSDEKARQLEKELAARHIRLMLPPLKRCRLR